jgi:hypothetical protein
MGRSTSLFSGNYGTLHPFTKECEVESYRYRVILCRHVSLGDVRPLEMHQFNQLLTFSRTAILRYSRLSVNSVDESLINAGIELTEDLSAIK